MISEKEEIRCGYRVSTEIKQLWNIELDLLEQFKSICQKYNLQYFAAGGTLLGAARHEGFIPWDDDIDINMPQKDYDKFLEVAPHELKAPYVLQSCFTESYKSPKHTRIRRSDTTGCTKWEKESTPDSYCKGIFIEVFCLSNVYDSTFLYKVQCVQMTPFEWAYKGHAFLKTGQKNKNKIRTYCNRYVISYVLLKIAYKNIKGINAKYMKLADKCTNNTSKCVGNIAFDRYNKKLIFRRELFNSTIDLKFEDTTICCPVNYDMYLQTQYGDWHKIVRGTEYHEIVEINPNRGC